MYWFSTEFTQSAKRYVLNYIEKYDDKMRML